MKSVLCLVLATFSAPYVSAQVELARPTALPPRVRQLGAASFPGGEAAFADAIRANVVLPSGAVIVTGTTRGSLGEPHAGASTTSDFFVARFDRHGDIEWIRQVGAITGPAIPALNGNPSGPGGDASQSELVDDLAVDANGDIYVTGSTRGSLGETHGGLSDFFLARFDVGGTLQWLRQIGVETAATIDPPDGAIHWGDPSGADHGNSVLIHATEGIYVGGWTSWNLGEDASGQTNFVLARFDALGRLHELMQMGEQSLFPVLYNANASDQTSGLALHPMGELVLAGTRLVIAGTTVTQDALLLTFDAALQPLSWATPDYFQLDTCNGLAIDEGSGRIYIAGETPGSVADTNLGAGSTDVLVTCYSAALDLLWVRQIGANAATALGLLDVAQYELASGIDIDAAGNFMVAGSTTGSIDEPNAGARDLFTLKLRGQDGLPIWAAQIGQTTATALGIDAGGDDTLGPHPLDLHVGGSILVGGATSGSLGETQAGAGDAVWLRLTKGGKLD